MPRPSPSRRLRRAAAAILLLGALASGAIYLTAHRLAVPDEYGPGSLAETRELQQLERLGGKASVMMLKFQLWFESLWHGERLAVTVAVLSVLVAGLCLHLASLADEDVGLQ